jgi:hypothetical protein
MVLRYESGLMVAVAVCPCCHVSVVIKIPRTWTFCRQCGERVVLPSANDATVPATDDASGIRSRDTLNGTGS